MSIRMLILGGARFHGLQAAEFFSGSGCEVYVLNRGNYKTSYGSDIKHLRADRNDADALKSVLKDKYFDVVIDNNAYNNSHINIIMDLIRDRCGHYIFTSSVAVYMVLSSDRRLKEDDATGILKEPYSPAVREYAINKLAAENALIENARGMNCTILRFPNIYGEGDFTAKLSHFYYRFRDGGRILLEEEVDRFSLIYVKDVVRALECVIRNEACRGRIINIADPVDYNYDEFFIAVYGDKYNRDKLLLVPAEKIWNGGYCFSFTWSPSLDTSLSQCLFGDLSYTPISVWSKDTLEWELENFKYRNLSPDYIRLREVELKLIEEYCGD